VGQSGWFRLIAGICALAVVGVLVLVITGGGGNDASLVSGSAIADAARATERVPGASVSVTGKIDVGGLPKPLSIRLRGIQDTRHRSAYLVGSYANFPKQVPGQSANGTIPVETITILPHVYLKSALFGAALPSGKSWVHIDVAKTGRRLGIGDPTQFGSGDPSQGVEALRAISSRVERLGAEGVRGVSTTHYRAKVELRRLPSVAPPAQRAAARKSVDRLIQLIGSDSYPIEVWVDRRHLVRRMRFVMKMKVQGRAVTQDMSIELYGFGQKQKIKPPPAGATVDASSLPGATP
jgi:hypothetical protein